MRRLCLLLLHYLSAVVDCSLKEGVTEFYDVDGSPVHMIVSGSVLVSDEQQEKGLRSNIPIKNTPFKYKKNEVLQSKAITDDNDIHSRKHKQRVNIKTIKNNRSKHVLRKKRLKGSKHKVSSKVRKYAYGKHGKLPSGFYKYGFFCEWDGARRNPQKSDKDPLQAERKTIYPPPSNMWKINKELSVTQQTLEEKGVLGERRIKTKGTGVADEVNSIEAQLENEQKTTSQEINLKFQSSTQHSLPNSLQTKIMPYQELRHTAHAYALDRKGQKEQHESQPNSMHRIEDHLMNHEEGQFHKLAEQKYINGKNLDNKQKLIINNQLKLRHTEALLHAKHALALPHKVTMIKMLDKNNEESKKINTLLTPPKYTKQIVLNSFSAHYAPEGEQEADAKAPERSTMTLESSQSMARGVEPTNTDDSSAASKKTNPSETNTITVESKPQEESTDASISEKYTENLPNTATKETSFLPQIQAGPQPGVQTEETVQQTSPNIDSQSSVDAEYTQTSMESQVPRPSAANSESLKREGAEENSQSYEQNAVNFCDSCENVEDVQTKAGQDSNYNNKGLQADSIDQTNQHQLANLANQVQNNGYEGPVKQTEDVIKEESEATPINEAVQNLSGVLQSKNTKDEAASQRIDISAKENEQFVSARKNEDDEITITAETPQEAGVQSEPFQNTTLTAKSLTSEKSNEVQKNLNPTDISSNPLIANSATSQSTSPIVEEVQMHQAENTSPLATNTSSIQVQLPDSSKIVGSELVQKDSALSTETNQYQGALKPVETDNFGHVQNQQEISLMKNSNQKAQEQFSKEKEEKPANFFMQNTEPHFSHLESNQVQIQSSYGKNKVNNIGFAVNPEDVPFDNKVAFAQAKEQEQLNAEAQNKPPISLGGDYSLFRQNDSASRTELESYASPAFESVSSAESEPTNEVLAKDEQLREEPQPPFFQSDAVGKFENSDPSHLSVQADTQGEALSRAGLAKSVTNVPKYKNLQAQSPVFEKFSTPQNIERTKADQFTNPLNSTTISAFSGESQISNSIDDDSYNTNGEYFLPAGVNPGAQMSSQMLDLWKLRGIAPQRGVLRGKIVNKNYFKHGHNIAVERNNAVSKKKITGSVSRHWSRMRQVPNNVMSVLKPKHPTGPSIAYQQTVPEEVMNSFSKQKSLEKVKSKVDESNEIEEDKGLDEKGSSSSSPEVSPAVFSPAPPAPLPQVSPESPASFSLASPPSSVTASAPASPPVSPPVSPAPSSAPSSAIAPGSSSAAHHEQSKPQTSGYGYGSGSGHGYGERSYGWGGGGGWAGVPPPNGFPLPSYSPPPSLPDFPKVGQTASLPAGSSPKLIHPVTMTSSVHSPLPNYLENKKHPSKLKYNPKMKVGYKSLLLTNKVPAKADIFKASKDQKVRVPVKTKSDVFPNSVTIRKKR